MQSMRCAIGDLARSLGPETHAAACNRWLLWLGLLASLAGAELAEAQSNWVERWVTGERDFSTGHAMAYDSVRGVTVRFGGWNGTYRGGTREWDGAVGSWTYRPGPEPSARYLHAMAYDSARGVTVLFGGDYYGPLGDTWEWDGTNWTQRTPATAPPARYSHAMVYDSARGVIVLFGGDSASGVQGDTWEWNGATGIWTQRSSTGPSPRYGHAMAYDSARGVTVLFGGRFIDADYTTYLYGDTWEWNGTTGAWTQRSTAGPSPRYGHAMAYHSARGVSVLFGGYNGLGWPYEYVFDDTWEWDGTTGAWIQRSTRPPARHSHAMAYDSARTMIVLFGGSDYWGLVSDTTWEYHAQARFPTDFDQDGDVDLTDFSVFQSCFNGPNRPPAHWDENCQTADSDFDGDVDLGDYFMMFEPCFNGPNRPPACQ